MGDLPSPRFTSESYSVGFDPDLQAIGGDAAGGPFSMGLPIPPTPPLAGAAPDTRYLFQLAWEGLQPDERVLLLGYRIYLEIGLGVPVGNGNDQAIYPLHREVLSPRWRFTDGNAFFGITRLGSPPNVYQAHAANAEGLAFQYTQGQALLFQRAPTDVLGYFPPNGGRFYGDPVAGLGGMHSLMTGWRDAHAWDSLGTLIKGPCALGLYASIRQTIPSTRVRLPANLPEALIETFSDEDKFVYKCEQAFVSGGDQPVPLGPIYTRVSGSLILRRV